ncbi:MAG: HAD hydrolase family protein [Treponema sp.]|nr:HAD hydrolase family protein [Treponema sp.]
MGVKLVIIDVDGTLTDGSVYYDEHGNELKKFNTRDAAGFFVAKELGIKIMILTGRACKATERRMSEMKVDYIFQNVKDKKSFLIDFFNTNNIRKEDIAYIGDDLNDFPGMRLSGWVGCPADSCDEVKLIANYVSFFNGGCGAVRDIIQVMVGSDCWNEAVEKIYYAGI